MLASKRKLVVGSFPASQYGNVSNKHNSQINFSNKLKIQTSLMLQQK